MGQLIWGITGIKPESQRIIQPKLPDNPSKQPSKNSKKPSQTDDLTSEKGIDYTKLRDLLAAHNWQEADQETYVVMIQTVGKKDSDWFTRDELLNFPCTDLRTIDQLWVKYSNGKFGFSVQKKIYLSVGGEVGGRYYDEAWNKFGDRVGWKGKGIFRWIWIKYSEVIFDISAPSGHLPWSSVGGMWIGNENCGVFLFSRMNNCKF
ncbi:GUN4 domain-containing protein [Nostoc sp.]|uniref:GUN4 domain-containing protein n=1 Tax=Nostoc sp. TaxID=1180 RepID=UPI002FFBA50F